MRKFYSLVICAAILECSVMFPVRAQTAYVFKSIDVPGSIATKVFGINDQGVIVGSQIPNNNFQELGFVAQSDGTGLVNLPQLGTIGTFAWGVNNHGVIGGGYQAYGDAGGTVWHGFITSDRGKSIIPIDVPESGTSSLGGTLAFAINDSSAVTGYWSPTASTPAHGFIRNPAGVYTSFDVPGESSTGLLRVAGLNGAGTASGNYLGVHGDQRGFFRAPDGNVASFIVPGADSSGSGTLANGINDAGEIVGFIQSETQTPRAFIRSSAGLNYFYADLPGLNYVALFGINGQKQLVGYYSNTMNGGDTVLHGFVATPNPEDPHPLFSVTSAVSGPPSLLTLSVTDQGSGLQAITVLNQTNAKVSIPAFAPGAKSATVTISKLDEAQPIDVVLSAKDAGNNETVMEASAPFIEVSQSIPGPPKQTTYGVSAMAGLVSVTTQQANGSIKVDPFTPGQTGIVHVTATKTDPSRGSSVTILATDRLGTVTTFSDTSDGSVSLSASSFHFAPHVAGETGGPGNIYIQNTLAAPIALNFGLQDGRYFAITENTCGASLATGASCQVFFTFSPPGPGDFTDSLQVQFNAAGSPLAIALSGSGLGSGLTVSPSNFSFAGHPVGETSGPGKVFVHNYGSNSLAILGDSVGGAAASDFQVVSTTCGATLPAYQTCSYTLTATPTASGFRNATLIVASSWTGSPQTVTLQTFGR